MADPHAGYRALEGRRVLITGGAGMIGSTVARLAASVGAKVTVLDNLAPLYGGNRFNLHDVEARFVEGDIRDMALVTKLVPEADVIFNLAAQVSYVDSNTDPFTDLDINCKGHLTVLEACRLHNKKARHVFSSSRFVYGHIERNPVDETHPFNCLSIYGVHKLNGEKYYQFYHQAHGLDALVFRIANPYGPRQQMKHGKYGILNWFIRQALEGRPLTVYGDGAQARDYVYCEDIARGMLTGAARTDVRYDVFNIGSGTALPFKEMARLIAEAVPGTKVQHVEWPKERYFVETGDYVSDIRKIGRVLGWKPQVPIAQGVKETVEYYKKFGKNYW